MKNYGVWVGFFLFLFSVFMVREALKYPYYGEYGPGPGLFPLWLSGLMGVFSILFMLDSLRKNNVISFSDVFPKGETLASVVKVVLSIFLFILMAPFLGYILSSVIVLLILLMPAFKWTTSLSTAASVTIVLYVVFNTILDIPLPTNMLGW